MVIGAFLPWWHVTSGAFTVDRNGFQLGVNESFSIDGAIAVGLAVVAILIGITRLTRSSLPSLFQRSPIIVAVGAGISLFSSVQGIRDTHLSGTTIDGIQIAAPTSTVGYGVWIVGIGIVLIFLGGLILHRLTTARSLRAELYQWVPYIGRRNR